jgi:hypothetical protein
MKRKPMGLIAALLATTGVVAGVNAQTISMRLTGSGLNLTVNFAGIAEPETAKADAKKHDEKALKVIDTYIEKIGGKDLIMSIKSMETTATMEIPMAGMKGKMKIYAAQPGRMATIMELPGFGTIESGYDGEYGWNSDPMSGPSLMDEEQVKAMSDQIDPNSAAKYRERYPTIEHHGEVDFKGQKVHKIRLVSPEGRESIEYYSVDTGLMVGQESTQPSQMGEIKVVATMSEYKEFGGMKMPTRVAQSLGAQEMIMTIESVKLNNVDPSVFKRPAAVEALIEAKKED